MSRKLAVSLLAAALVLAPALVASAAPTQDQCATIRDQVAKDTLVLDAAASVSGETTEIRQRRKVNADALRYCGPAPSPSGSSSPEPSSSTVPSSSPTAAPPPTPTSSPPPAAWPGPDNTGVPVGTVLSSYSGSCTVSSPMLIDAKLIACDLTIAATGVRITRSSIIGSVSVPEGSSYSVSLEDSEVDAGKRLATGVSGDNFTVLRTEISGGNRGVYCRRACTVQDSWVHGTYVESSWHASGMRAEQGSMFTHNTIACDWLVPTALDGGCSADVTMYPDFAPVKNVLVQGNLFVANPSGAAFCAYGGASPGKPYSGDPTNATYIRFIDNVFQRGSNRSCAAYGPIDSYDGSRTGNEWVNNRWDSGEAVIP